MVGEEIGVPVRNYKDSVFRMLFSEKHTLLGLYNALNGTEYADPDELEINTLKNAIYLGRKNDISFIIQSQLYLYEHQSTANPNMPLRNLFYLAELYTRMTDEENLHGSRKVFVPRPHFIVFYNGTDRQPERQTLKLSEAFLPLEANEPTPPDVELKTLFININKGCNEELKKNCQDLYGYMIYVDRVRENAKKYSLELAVELAIDSCIREGILKNFLSKRRAEVMSMSIYEYDQEKHFRQIAEDSRSEGWNDGRAVGKAEGKAEMIVYILRERGEVSQELVREIMSERDLNKLEIWFKLALKVDTVDRFVQEMSG
ncbi:MAG: hypothetical protein IJZ85_02215 [Lachnospiraceae bacterium]|nr:hypothetical protein [Lachnospiraceae bacterium]